MPGRLSKTVGSETAAVPLTAPGLLRRVERKLRQTGEQTVWSYHAWRLRRFFNRHAGQRCFIIGNGPSLRHMDLPRLRGEITFGLNRIYLLSDQMGFMPTYYVAVNPLVLEQFAGDIRALRTTKFVSWPGRRWVGAAADTFLIKSVKGPCFSTDLRQGYWEGATVTYAAMQIAYYMGFSRVILVGVDHRFVTPGKPHAELVATADDPDHFSPQYFGRGLRWNLPDLETSELAYRMARWRFEKSGRVILDATVGGHLTVFPKVRFEDSVGGDAVPGRTPAAR